MNHTKYSNIINAILAVIMLNSCNGNNNGYNMSREPSIYFADSLNVIDNANISRSEIITGDTIIDEAMGAYTLNVVDSIICLANRQSDMMFSFYNLNGDSIASLGHRGQGPSDFTNNDMNRQSVVSDGNTCIWIVDVNSAALKRLNLTKSIQCNQSCVDSIIPIRSMVTKAFLVGDTIIQEVMADGNYDLSLSSIDGKSLYQEPLYKHKVDLSELFMFYKGTMAVSPNGKHLVIAMSAINQINIIDLTNGEQRYAVSVGGVESPHSVLDPQNHTNIWTYYSNLSLGDNYIYALYENQPYDTGDNEMKKSEIHLFDYEGNLVKILPLDRFLYAISYSGKNNSLYGLDDNENVLRYDLSTANL